MRLILILFLFLYNAVGFAEGITDPITKIAKANKAKELASKAFGNANYEEAVAQYNFILDSLGYKSDALELNRAHAYFQMKDTLRAFNHYRAASMSDQKPIQSKAFNQLGVLSEQQQQKKEALSYYKEALRADPANKDARYNYELLKKKLQEEEKKQQDQKGQDQNQDQKDQEKSDQEKDDKKEGEGEEKSKGDKKEGDPSEGEKGDPDKEKQKQESEDKKEGEKQEGEQQEGKEQSDKESEASQQEQDGKEGDKSEAKPSTSEKLKAMNVSQEKAKQILEALRNKEAQYLQQTRKRATKKKDSSKPDW